MPRDQTHLLLIKFGRNRRTLGDRHPQSSYLLRFASTLYPLLRCTSCGMPCLLVSPVGDILRSNIELFLNLLEQIHLPLEIKGWLAFSRPCGLGFLRKVFCFVFFQPFPAKFLPPRYYSAYSLNPDDMGRAANIAGRCKNQQG